MIRKVGLSPFLSSLQDVPPDNEFEKRIRPEVVPAGEVGVRFSDIGALENVKETLQELVMLPLRRPELFNRGGLVKVSCELPHLHCSFVNGTRVAGS